MLCSTSGAFSRCIFSMHCSQGMKPLDTRCLQAIHMNVTALSFLQNFMVITKDNQATNE
jgi:hypothetical protein